MALRIKAGQSFGEHFPQGYAIFTKTPSGWRMEYLGSNFEVDEMAAKTIDLVVDPNNADSPLWPGDFPNLELEEYDNGRGSDPPDYGTVTDDSHSEE